MSYNKKWEKKEERDYQKELTDRFVARLKEAEDCVDKGLTWDKPFFTCSQWPYNAFTKEKYHGGNIISLISEEFSDPRWLTFNQMKELSKSLDTELTLEKGSKAAYIMKVVPSYQKDSSGEILKSSEGKPIPVLNDDGSPKIGFKWFPVFNASCVKGLEPYIKPNQEVKPFEVVEMFSEALKERTGLKVEHSARGKAYYSPSEHKIHMPNHEFFKSSEAYADTFFHESGHSTGKAMGRDMSGKFGAEGEAGKKYAHEELIAELSSSFLSVELNIPHNPSSHENQAAYIKSWIQVLENDKTFIFKASNQASKAVEYMVGHYNSYKQELEQKQSMKDSEVEVINFADKLASSFAKQKTVQSKSSALSM